MVWIDFDVLRRRYPGLIVVHKYRWHEAAAQAIASGDMRKPALTANLGALNWLGFRFLRSHDAPSNKNAALAAILVRGNEKEDWAEDRSRVRMGKYPAIAARYA